jgi:cytoskeletal protein CcmA (bactofilin family)
LSTNNSANRGDAPGNLTIGEGVKVVGQLVVPGLAVINGTLQGELQADELLVGPKGSLSGQVRVRTADIHGTTHETLEASEFLCVRGTGHVNGQARYGEIEIEKGGVIRGAISPVGESIQPAPVALPPSVPAPADSADSAE